MSASDESPTDRVRRQYRTNIRRIVKLPELEMRSASLRETLAGLPPRVAICWLDQMVRGALWGRRPNLDIMLALSYELMAAAIGQRDPPTPRMPLDRWRTLAEKHELRTASMLLMDHPPHRTMLESSELPEVQLPIERAEVTVGRRRTLAQKGNRDYIDRLVHDPDPLVIEDLLDNPRLEERDVLRIVTRRPTRPELLQPVCRHATWFGRRSVRKALAHNPYVPTGWSMKLLPTLGIQVLRKIQYGSDLAPELVESAEYLTELREERTAPWRV